MTTNAITGSAQQIAIWDCLGNDNSNIVVEALAGTGKTFTIVEGLRQLPPTGSYCFVAFNKSIATELQSRVPPTTQALTLHGMGLKVISNAWGYVKRDANKVIRMLPENVDYATKVQVQKLVSLVKGMLTNTDDESLNELCLKYDIDTNSSTDEVYSLVRMVMSKAYGKQTEIDFDDMIWLPVALSLPTTKYDVLMVDEAQDLNRAQQELVLQSAKRIVMVGDKHQAIYGFRGADVESMQRMTDTLASLPNGVKVFPLTVTRRCAQAITEAAAALVPAFECLPDAPRGTVNNQYSDTVTFNKGDMVLCRTNAPLIRQAYALISSATPVKIQGRDIGAGLATFIKKLVPVTASTTELLRRSADYFTRESIKINEQYSNGRATARIQTLTDKCECIEALCDSLDTVQDVLARIQALFSDIDKSDNNQFVLLSSVHRAKGLESTNVYILHPELLPHPMAKLPWQLEQEMNLRYVAITRAKLNLTFVN